ncbi:MAG: SLC13 family permease [Lysobacterales bacterium]
MTGQQRRKVFRWVGLIAALTVLFAMRIAEMPDAMAWTTAITTLCAVWWITEAIPIPATSLVPLALLPATGALSARDVGAAFGSPLILLFLGGFILSAAMARSGAHRRIALNVVRLFGGRAGRPLVLGFMVTGAFLSMWISNVATTLMLLPIVLAITEHLDDRRLRVVLLIAIAYACSIGGIGTPVGTPPNLIFLQVYGETVGETPSFAEWMGWALPVVALMLPLAALWLTRGMKKGPRIELPHPGPITAEEQRTLIVFAATALLWITRKEPFGGWSELLGVPGVNDASVALMAAVALFLIPSGRGNGRLMDWETAAQIPWGILILFGSGIAIADAFASSGLSELIGRQMVGFQEIPPVLMVGVICLTVTFLTEITSNTATTALLMPVLAAAAVGMGVDPRLIMLPACLSASMAFMLPVATGPNAAVFGSGYLRVPDMAREGLVLNLVGAAIITLVVTWLV